MAEKKMTKKEMFAVVRGIVEASEQCTDEVLAFIDHEVELLSRKSDNSKKTKSQIENEAVMAKILEALAEVGEPVTISDLQKTVPAMAEYSNQKLSSLLKKLVEDEKKVIKTIDKKKSYFSLAE